MLECYINPSIQLVEHHRIQMTRLRLSAHNLRIETGRWSRIPRELRLCDCGLIQIEYHFICEYINTENVHQKYPELDFTSLANLFTGNLKLVASAICKCLRML